MTDWKRKNLWLEQETGQAYTPKKTKKQKKKKIQQEEKKIKSSGIFNYLTHIMGYYLMNR